MLANLQMAAEAFLLLSEDAGQVPNQNTNEIIRRLVLGNTHASKFTIIQAQSFVATYDILASGNWIDDVPNIPGVQLSPEFQAAIFLDRGELIDVDECEQMRFYRGLVTDFWRDEPGEKGKLAVQAAGMLWSPTFTVEREERSAGLVGVGKEIGEPAYMIGLYVLAAVGLFLVRRPFAILAVALLAYNTLAAMVFVGNVRYRVPWDFLLALLAAAALERVWRKRLR